MGSTPVVRPVTVEIGTGIGSLHRGRGWLLVDLRDPELIALLNEFGPGFVNLRYTLAPSSIEHVVGLAFYPESAGAYSQRLSHVKTFESVVGPMVSPCPWCDPPAGRLSIPQVDSRHRIPDA